MRANLVVCEYHAVESSMIADDTHYICSNIAQVRQGNWDIAIASDAVRGFHHGVIDAARRDARQIDLIPPANIHNGIWQFHVFDVVQHVLFLPIGVNTISLSLFQTDRLPFLSAEVPPWEVQRSQKNRASIVERPQLWQR